MPLPLILAGAAGAYALAKLFESRPASAATLPESTPRAALFDFGRPMPASIEAIVSSGWARPRHGRLHRGLDIPVPMGTAILAIDDGVVVRVQRHDVDDAGLHVDVRHRSGVTSRYLHLSKTLVDVEQKITRGAVVGRSGNTGNSAGPHLHLDLRAPRSLLPAIEAVIGAPRSGYGKELRDYGVSIAGEPWIPVDGYRPIVVREAAEHHLPLRSASPRNGALVYRPVGSPGEPYPEWLQRLKGSSGVYVIRIAGEVVYVGESHTNRIYETLTRHLQDWRRYKGFWKGAYGEGHDPGLTYPRGRVEVAVKVTQPSRAIDEEARLIRRLRPRDNLLGQPELEDAPF